MPFLLALFLLLPSSATSVPAPKPVFRKGVAEFPLWKNRYRLTVKGTDVSLFENGVELGVGFAPKIIGDFSDSGFTSPTTDTIHVIVNCRLPRLLLFETHADSSGFALIDASPDGKFLVVADRFSSTTPTPMEVWTAEGEVVLKARHFGETSWDEEGLAYTRATALPRDTNAETKKCLHSDANRMEEYLFDGKTDKKLKTPSKIQCTR